MLYNLKNPDGTALAVSGSGTLYFHKITVASGNPVKIKGIDITPESVTAAHTKPVLSLCRLSVAGTFNGTLTPRELRLSEQACPGTFHDYATSAPTVDTLGDIFTWFIPATAPFVYRFQPGEEPVIQTGELWCWKLVASTNGMNFYANTILENG